jgi:hypothetical protein
MESESASFIWFVLNVLPLLILGLGLIGNLLGILVLSRKKMDEIGPLKSYRYIFIFDSVYLIPILIPYLKYTYSIDFISEINFICKIYIYFTSSFASISSLLLIYILFERYLSISHPTESNLLRKDKTQFIYLIVIIILNLIYYSPVPFYYYSHIKVNSTQIECSSDSDDRHIISI